MTRAQQLKDFGPAYFDHVLAQFELYKENKRIPPYIREIIESSQKTPERLTWKDVYALEEFVLEIEPLEVAKARAANLERSYSELTGRHTTGTALRARERIKPILARILDTLHWIYSMVPAREQMRSDILKESGKWILVCFAVLLPISIGFAVWGNTLLATLPLVVLMGALGGFVSLQRRIQNIPTDRDPLITMLELQNGRFSVALAPLLGSVFAVVLFFIFLSGLLQGTIFPTQLTFGTWKIGGPVQAAALMNAGKLLLWSFVAGFAESFVPDTLDSITAQGRRQQSQRTPPSTSSTVAESELARSDRQTTKTRTGPKRKPGRKPDRKVVPITRGRRARL